MKLHELRPAEGSRQVRDRVSRDTSSSSGKTARHGQKGQKARLGDDVRLGFEGGQTPLLRRLPRRGPTDVNRKDYAVINPGVLNRFEDGAKITPVALAEAGVAKSEKAGIKVLTNGELDKKLTTKVARFPETAREAIEATGGSTGAV